MVYVPVQDRVNIPVPVKMDTRIAVPLIRIFALKRMLAIRMRNLRAVRMRCVKHRDQKHSPVTVNSVSKVMVTHVMKSINVLKINRAAVMLYVKRPDRVPSYVPVIKVMRVMV